MPKESIIEIIPKPKLKTPLWINFCFWFSLIVLAGVVGSFFLFSYEIASLKKERSALEAQISSYGTKDQKEEKENLMVLSQKIKDFSGLFSDHILPTKLLDFLKESCHKEVQFTYLNFDSQNLLISLDGLTESFHTLGEQILVFKSKEEISELRLSNVSIGEAGQVNFNLSFNIKNSFLKR